MAVEGIGEALLRRLRRLWRWRQATKRLKHGRKCATEVQAARKLRFMDNLGFNLIQTKEMPMKTKAMLEAADVATILQAAQAEAQAHNWAVTIAVVDEGGHLLGLTRLDGAAPISAHIAPGKAVTSALGCRESAVYEKVVNDGRYSFLSVSALPAKLEGGVPIMVNGVCVGAVGVSGVKSDEDAQIAKAGIAALQLA